MVMILRSITGAALDHAGQFQQFLQSRCTPGIAGAWLRNDFHALALAEFDAPLIDTEVVARAETRVSTRVRVVRSVDVKT